MPSTAKKTTKATAKSAKNSQPAPSNHPSTETTPSQPMESDGSDSTDAVSSSSIDLAKNPPADKDTRAAFQQHLAQIEAFPETQVSPPTTNAFDAVTLALQLHQQAQKDLARLRKLIASGELAEASVIELRTRALALWYAESRWQHARKAKRPKSEQIHFPEAVDLRKEFLDAADYLWRRDPRVKKTLTDIREGNSQRDLADDLQRLAQLFLEHLDFVDGRTDITTDDIDRAIALSVQIMDTLLEQDQKEAIRLRNRAFSLLADAYLDVFMAGRFIHRRDKKTSALYPSLYPASSASSQPTEIPPTPPQEIPQPV